MRGINLRSGSVALGVLLVLWLTACASKPSIRTDSDRSADFTAYRTFNFAPELGTNRAGYSTLITSYFMQVTRREMEARGYRYSETQPDLLVNFNTNVREVVELETYPTVDYYGYRTYGGFHGSAWYGDMKTVHYKVGTANVDLIDVSRNQLVWEGVAEGKLTDKVMDNPQAAIDKVVTELFRRFPVDSAAS